MNVIKYRKHLKNMKKHISKTKKLIMNLMQKMPSEEQKNIYCQIHNRKTKIKITKIKITQIKITQIKIINQK
jgi:hypothetical protein